MKKIYFMILVSIFLFGCSDNKEDDNKDKTICSELTCTQNAQCKVKKDASGSMTGFCECNPGYEFEGDLCIKKNVASCEGKSCQDNSTCKLKDGLAVCECDDGFQLFNNECVFPISSSFEYPVSS